jgi:hypothetical protein
LIGSIVGRKVALAIFSKINYKYVNPTYRKLSMTESKQKEQVKRRSVDLSKEFNQFIKENKKLLKKLAD